LIGFIGIYRDFMGFNGVFIGHRILEGFHGDISWWFKGDLT
jgi:hypothetical protein